MCMFCGCEDGFQSVKVILPSAEEAKPESAEVRATVKVPEKVAESAECCEPFCGPATCG